MDKLEYYWGLIFNMKYKNINKSKVKFKIRYLFKSEFMATFTVIISSGMIATLWSLSWVFG